MRVSKLNVINIFVRNSGMKQGIKCPDYFFTLFEYEPSPRQLCSDSSYSGRAHSRPPRLLQAGSLEEGAEVEVLHLQERV